MVKECDIFKLYTSFDLGGADIIDKDNFVALLRKFRLKLYVNSNIKKLIINYKKPSILDFGCGDGLLAKV